MPSDFPEDSPLAAPKKLSLLVLAVVAVGLVAGLALYFFPPSAPVPDASGHASAIRLICTRR